MVPILQKKKLSADEIKWLVCGCNEQMIMVQMVGLWYSQPVYFSLS